MTSLPLHEATRYLVPLREGGSLPAVVETTTGGLYVVKFRGAGQGAKALVAEVIVAGLADALGLPVPASARIELDADFGRTEPDPEIQDILKGSRGANFGMRYLDGALNFDPVAAGDLVDEDFASRLVWLDALVTNPDRSPRNPNLLVHDESLWLIDHGAALFAHHSWRRTDEARTRTRFEHIAQHVLLDRATMLGDVDRDAPGRLGEDVLRAVVERVPDSFLEDPVSGGEFENAAAARRRYVEYLTTRLRGPRSWVEEAIAAHTRARSEPRRPLSSRR